MKTAFAAILSAAAIFLSTPMAQADDHDLLVGKWEMNTTMNGYMERGIMTLRANGEGQLVRYAWEQDTVTMNFRWSLRNGGIRLFYGPKDVKYVRLNFERTNTIILTPATASMKPIGPDMEYERKFEEGAAHDATSRDQMVGVWEAAGKDGWGNPCRIELYVRDYGTGEHSISCGPKRLYAETGWTFSGGVIRETQMGGGISVGRVRFLDKDNMGITPLGPDGLPNGEETFYQKTAQSGDGC